MKSPDVGGGVECCRKVNPGFKVPFIGLGENPFTCKRFPRIRSSYIEIGFGQQHTLKNCGILQINAATCSVGKPGIHSCPSVSAVQSSSEPLQQIFGSRVL